MNEIQVATAEVKDLSPAQLGGEIRLLTAQARRMALSYGIQIGYRLKIAHEKVGPHGWADWLKSETDFSAAAASRFEKLYEGYGADQGSLFGVENKFPTLEKLSISNALRVFHFWLLRHFYAKSAGHTPFKRLHGTCERLIRNMNIL